jgi:VWFA-related protein
MKLILLNSHSVAKRHLAALFVCAVVLAGTSNAQDAPPPGTTVLHVDSRLVVLDVVVTGKDGKPVPGLGKKDFTVLEDGQPQRIRSVDYTASPSDPASHSRTILVLDALNNSIEETSYAKSELEHYVATLPEILLQPAMLIAIDDDGLHVLIASTRNRDAVRKNSLSLPPS